MPSGGFGKSTLIKNLLYSGMTKTRDRVGDFGGGPLSRWAGGRTMVVELSGVLFFDQVRYHSIVQSHLRLSAITLNREPKSLSQISLMRECVMLARTTGRTR